MSGERAAQQSIWVRGCAVFGNAPGVVETSAAVGRQKTDQRVHGRQLGAVDPRPTVAFACDEARTAQLLEVEEEGRGRQVDKKNKLRFRQVPIRGIPLSWLD